MCIMQRQLFRLSIDILISAANILHVDYLDPCHSYVSTDGIFVIFCDISLSVCLHVLSRATQVTSTNLPIISA